MTSENIRNNIIDKLLTISNKGYLSALYQIINKSGVDTDIIDLTESQLLILQMSERDLNNGRILSQEELNQQDLEGLGKK